MGTRSELAYLFRDVADAVAEDIWNKIKAKGGGETLFASHSPPSTS